jgi:cell division septal protein FtsQ
MSQVYRKPHSYKKKKPVFKNKFFWLGILVCLAAASFFYFLIFSNFFQIDKITVEGVEKLSVEEIESLASDHLEKTVLFFKTKSIFLFKNEEVQKQISTTFPLAGEVEVSRQLPGTIKISLKEKIALALWCENINCFEIDKEGVIFQEALVSADLIKIESDKEGLVLGERAVEKDLLMKILDINSKLKQKAGILVETIEIASTDRLNVKTSEGWQIYFNLSGDLDWQITELSLVLEKEISSIKRRNLEYIDLRFSKVYYK